MWMAERVHVPHLSLDAGICGVQACRGELFAGPKLIGTLTGLNFFRKKHK